MAEGATADSVREQVSRILGSDGFARAERLRRFMKFTVDYALDGRSAELKEYLIGIEVFDKDASFDPRIDTGVRVEARRLRAALTNYYAGVGQNDPVLIEYPKGSYAPVFRNRGTAGPQQPKTEISAARQPLRAFVSLSRTKLLYGAALSLIAVVALWAIAERRTYNAARQLRQEEPINSVAVLPFADMSRQKDQEYFCDGLTEELIHALTKIGGLRVVARTSAFQFKEKPADIRLIGQQLKVGAVLEGSVRKDGNRLRITAQLNSTADGYHLWSETYDREARDVFAVQKEIAGSVVKTLKVSLDGATVERLVDAGSENQEAHNLYLKGRYFWAKWTAEARQKSIASFERAIALDPRYARAYVGLADAYAQRAFDGDLTPREAQARKGAVLAKAFELNPRLSAAWASRATSKAMYDFDWAGAEQDYRHAIELDPKDPEARDGFAVTLMCLGRFDEAREQLARAQDVDPLSVTISAHVARVSYLARQYDRAIAEATRSLDLDAPFFRIHEYLGLAYLQKKMFGPAVAALEKCAAVSERGLEALGNLGYGYAVAGRRAEAEKVLAQLRGRRRRVSPVPLVKIYVGLGQTGRALDLLEQAYEDREGRLMWVNVAPEYDPLRSAPRFQNLLKEMGFPSHP